MVLLTNLHEKIKFIYSLAQILEGVNVVGFKVSNMVILVVGEKTLSHIGLL